MEGTETATATPTSSAPATSGASSGESSRPTMAQAFAANPIDASPTPVSDQSQSATPAEATLPPADATTQATPAPGPLPFEAHKRILDGAYKERDALKGELATLKQQFDSPDGQRLRQWAQGFQQNPEQWFGQTVADLAASRPDLVPALRSQAARLLGSRMQPATDHAATSFEPDIPVYDETGRQVSQTYSAERVQAMLKHAVSDALQREVAPMKSDFEQRKQQQEFAEVQKQAQSVASQQFETAKQWPGFLADAAKGTVDPDLVKAFGEHPDWSLEGAYINVVVPKLRAREQAGVLDSLKTKAAASTGVNPAGAVVAANGKRPKSMLDPALRW